MTINHLIKLIRREQQRKYKIVLIHGVFDLFHNGHLYTLKKAKELGDVLVVGVDSDRLVALIKGNNRPIQTLKERMEMLKACKYVDYVFEVNHKHTVELKRKNYFINLYRKIKPDIIVTGKKDAWSNFQNSICKKLGIKFVIIGESAHKSSTSKIIDKILKRYASK